MKISVAMTTYNGSKYIKQQLNSIFNQIRKVDEVIIVDDCSHDNTIEIINNFIENHKLLTWKVFVNKNNLGFIENFKKAISLTTGDIVFLCDQDDIWYDDKVETFNSIFTSNPNVLSLSSQFSIIDKDGVETQENSKQSHNLINQKITKLLQPIGIKAIMHSNISPGCTTALRREIADLYVKNTSCILPHDYEINTIAAAKNGLYYYDKSLTKYRIHSDNTLGLSSSYQTRIEIAHEKLILSEVIMYASCKNNVYRVCSERFKSLTEHKLLPILKLMFNKYYLIIFSLRVTIGDIIYILRRK